jgi:hypothetical protein
MVNNHNRMVKETDVLIKSKLLYLVGYNFRFLCFFSIFVTCSKYTIQRVYILYSVYIYCIARLYTV